MGRGDRDVLRFQFSCMNSQPFVRYTPFLSHSSFAFYGLGISASALLMLIKSHEATCLLKAHDYISPEGRIPIRIFAQSYRLGAVAVGRCCSWSSGLAESRTRWRRVGARMTVGCCSSSVCRVAC